MKKGLICFDLDNTLIDSEKAHVLAYNSALVKNGFKKVSFNKIVKLFGMPNIDLVKILTKSKNNSINLKVYYDHYDFLVKKYYKFAKPFPNVKYTLKKLSQKYKLAIVSNTSNKSIKSLLKGSKLNKNLFNVLIGNDNVAKSKPWPDEILKAEKLLKLKADFIVGDSIYDVIAGKRSNVSTIAITSGRFSRKQLMKYKPDYILNEFKDLLNII